MQQNPFDCGVTLDTKLAALHQPSAYPGPPPTVEAIETHMSWVFLTPQTAYKLKKPVRYDHLDFSTLEARRFYCLEELRLNRHLAGSVYVDAVALALDTDGALRIGGQGQVVDWLVRMHRLPAPLMLDRMLENGTATSAHLRSVAKLLADFYRGLAPVDIGPARYL